MVTIEIGNSYSKINNLTSAPFNKLRKVLSYNVDAQAAYFSNTTHNTVRYVIDKQGNFATGLLARVINFLQTEAIKYIVSDSRKKPSRIVNHKTNLKHIKPYAWQVQATDVMTTKHRCIVSATTGTGKSLVIALITARLSVRTLIVVPSLQIKEQLTDSLSGVFNDMSNITVENIDSTALKTAKDYDLLIIDEAHHSASKTYRNLNKTAWSGIFYRAFLTATPFRNNTEETLLFEGVAGSTVYALGYKEAVKNKYIVPIEAYYITVPKSVTDACTWAEVYSELVVNNKNRNVIIANFLLTLLYSDISTLCLVKEVAHGEIISRLTGVPFTHGQDEETRRYITQFNNKEINVLIGTEGILGEGVDTKPCEFVIIAGLGKAKSSLMQKIGRTIRTYPGKTSGKVILIKDTSHKFTKSHFKEECKIIQAEYEVMPIGLDL